MALHTDLQDELKDALRAKDEVRLRTIRSVLTAFTNELVAGGQKPNEVLDDEKALAVVGRLAKQRQDSIEQFEKGGRNDLAQIEREELTVLEKYLPEMMSKEELEPLVKAKMEALGVTDKSGTGQLMGALMSELKGKADGKDIKEIVDSLLS